jgi:tRNA G18 (ribose-2'-O)-methylase SpoU
MTIAPDLSDFSKEEIRETLNEIRHPFEVAVHSSENYFNMGAILRAGHSFLCRKFWMVDFDKFYKRATMGAHKYENIEKCTLNEFFERNVGRNIVAFEKRTGVESVDVQTYKYPENPILFFGSEKFGVPDDVIARAKTVVTIPLYGIHNDLNVAVAAGIGMYDFVSKMYQSDRKG